MHIVDDLAFNQNIGTDEELGLILAIVQGLEPAGVPAIFKNVSYYSSKGEKKVHSCSEIVELHFDAFTKSTTTRSWRSSILMKPFDLDEIIKLNPKPGSSFGGGGRVISQAITPDFYIEIKDGKVEYLLNSRNAPELNISREYKNLLEQYKAQKTHSKSYTEAVLFVKQKIDSAKWLVDAIRHRQRTLLLVIDALVERHESYFLTGDESDLQPMILKDIAEMTELDISTVSLASNKYAQTPYGTFLLKELFSESMTNDRGEEVSTREIKKFLKELIEQEQKSKPLRTKIATALKGKGYSIARRTNTENNWHPPPG